MEWSERGRILSVRGHGETGAIVELGDWVADALGALVAAAAYVGWPRYRNLLETSWPGRK